MWQGFTVSVVLPTYNEKDSIYACIQDFFATEVVDEIIVVNNNAATGTSQEVSRTRAIEVLEPEQGYGHAVRKGLATAAGDIIVLSEPDGTFLGRDIMKLLAYCVDFEVVFGTRTAKDFIWEGANMGPFLRWGNWAVAKLIEVLFNTTNLTDVGCTMRLIKRPALERIRGEFRVGGNFSGPEMMLLSAIHGLKMVQVPVNYCPRVGTSSVTGDLGKAVSIGFRMIGLILDHRWRSLTGNSRSPVERP
ncbi:MAG: glycosyltransferase family 2 protein [Dehalococcoidia bacterium]|nr:glycosyltransferase family 2 protein [Dehalococcoidia bacterium]